MSIEVACPWCHGHFQVADFKAGQKTACVHCQQLIRVRIPSLPDVDRFKGKKKRQGKPKSEAAPAARAIADPFPLPVAARIQPGSGQSLPSYVDDAANDYSTKRVSQIAIVAAAMTTVGVAIFLGLGIWLFGQLRSPPAKEEVVTRAETQGPFIPSFPEMEKQKTIRNRGIDIFGIDLKTDTRNSYNIPAGSMQLRVFMPALKDLPEHAPGSLTCVLIPSGGPDFFHGYAVKPVEQLDEFFPYVSAGMVVVHFSTDGELPHAEYKNKTYFWDDSEAAFRKFAAADGGCENARFAMEFVRQKLPMVHPGRIYIAGQFSGGSVALQYAAREPRLAGCLAYTPCVDFQKQIERNKIPAIRQDFIKLLQDFSAQNSPAVLVQKIRCPVYLFHTKQDEEFPFEDTQQFSAHLKASNARVVFSLLAAQASDPAYDHIEFMNGVNWIVEDVSPIVLPKAFDTIPAGGAK
jgi:dienelactone hydrolase